MHNSIELHIYFLSVISATLVLYVFGLRYTHQFIPANLPAMEGNIC
jgi:hypothetical protein